MSILLGTLLAILVFFIVVFLHEMWHFFVARWSGVKVHEFGIGIPPRLKRILRDKKGTDWTLNWLPLGWFVRLKGEDFFSPESREKDALPQAPWWKQVAILLAGVTMNFILAACLFGALFYRGTEPLTIQIRELHPESLLSHISSWTQLVPIFDTLEQAEKAGVLFRSPGVVIDPLPDSPAVSFGLQRADVVLSIDSKTLLSPEEFKSMISQWGPRTLGILRGTEEFDVVVTPKDGKIGAYVAPNIRPIRYQYGLISSLWHGIREVGYQIVFSFRTFGAIISTSFSDTASHEEKKEATAGIGGPVAIGRVFVGLADNGIAVRSIIILTAMISLSLWVFNLLPFPALDGGRCLLVIVNQMIHVVNPRFKISPRIEQIIHSAGFIILILASILVTWKDIFIHN